MQKMVIEQRDDLYVITLSNVIYFMADDHYTHVHLSSGQRTLLPYGLQAIEQKLSEVYQGKSNPFVRLGRKYIVNVDRAFRIATVKQELSLLDDTGQFITLHLSKPVLREFHDQYILLLYSRNF